MGEHNWWQGAVIYQVYPRSFRDSNNDGVGDIKGIIEKIDYIANLGVDALWISPFFKSPMKDFGYDISDYRAVEPVFGTLEDFDELVKQAHARNLKVMIDQVLSHTSDQHAWFQESRLSQLNAKSDWYVWADPKPDGSPPNNWLSIFGGSAWEWEPRRGQYYFHNFLTSQPDLNYHNPEVRKQILKEIEFWLKRGVDGLRLDAINFCFHDKLLRNNPIKPEAERKEAGFSKNNPYAAQRHLYDNTQVENLLFLEALRKLLDRYPGVVSLGEINSEDSLKTISEYVTGHSRLHLGYSFELLAKDCSAHFLRQTVETLESNIHNGWPCWAISNHDVKRVMSRWASEKDELAKLFSILVCSLRGAVCTYQGEELGLPEASLLREQIRDPYGVEFWPEFKGRDGCRTPMPWNSHEKHAGFSHEKPWLPIPQKHLERSVSKQQFDKCSPLHTYRAFMLVRREFPALIHGSIKFLDAPKDVLVILRQYRESGVIAAFNLSEQSQRFTLHCDQPKTQIHISGVENGYIENQKILLPSHGVAFYALPEPEACIPAVCPKTTPEPKGTST